MRRAVYIILAVAGYIAASIWIYHAWWIPYNHSELYDRFGNLRSGHSIWLMMGVLSVTLAFGFIFTVFACSPNIYHIRDGKVIERKSVNSGKMLLKLRREDGRTGWVRVVAAMYPQADVGQYVDLRR